MKALITENDLQAAIDWRLEGAPPDAVEKCVEAVFDLTDMASPIRDDDRAVAAILVSLASPHDRRDPWGLLCAMVAVTARTRKNIPLFWASGMEVVFAHRQALRAPAHGKDQLSVLITAHLTERPELSPAGLFREFAEHAGTGIYPALCDFDSETGNLSYQPSAATTRIEDIDQKAFVRRVQRIRRQLHPCSSDSDVRQLPAYVATGT